MVKLTTELIMNSYQFINPVKDRELDLRGYKIPLIENMGATLDQFDTIDFSDNDIRKIDGFAYLKRLKNIIFNNNAIVRIADNLEQCLPNLESLILTGNQIQELGDLDPLASLPKLKMLSLLHNPVASKEHYRLYVAHKIPQVRILDFRKVKLKEYEAAKTLFKGKEGKELKKKLVKKSNQFVPGEGLENRRANGHSQADMWRIRKAISEASSLEEVEQLSKLLEAGQIPNKDQNKKSVPLNGENIEEFDDDDDDNDDNNEAPTPME
ncbi:U2 small nuclear ribonucleoprotein A' isoform X2 [Rhopalosiphum maidis]|uniref:U2 small nuclear ribonucleoprotein A' isoform X2 n=1 Tax=Rhopalosiphum maidis TaxID=43146 RepID=UPI000EFE2DD9|nr:U2 small nuclear ribonucleoprotein A' isoform X2 [Rhopalosiphum maidis]